MPTVSTCSSESLHQRKEKKRKYFKTQSIIFMHLCLHVIWFGMKKKKSNVIKNCDLLSSHPGCLSAYVFPHVWEKTRASEMTRALLSKDSLSKAMRLFQQRRREEAASWGKTTHKTVEVLTTHIKIAILVGCCFLYLLLCLKQAHSPADLRQCQCVT